MKSRCECYMKKIHASDALKHATEESKKEPGCDVLKIDVLRLQDEISRPSAEYDQEHQKLLDRRSRFNKVKMELLDTRSRSKPVSVEPLVESQTPGFFTFRMI